MPDDAAAWQLVLNDPSYVMVDAFYGSPGGPPGEAIEPGRQYAVSRAELQAGRVQGERGQGGRPRAPQRGGRGRGDGERIQGANDGAAGPGRRGGGGALAMALANSFRNGS